MWRQYARSSESLLALAVFASAESQNMLPATSATRCSQRPSSMAVNAMASASASAVLGSRSEAIARRKTSVGSCRNRSRSVRLAHTFHRSVAVAQSNVHAGGLASMVCGRLPGYWGSSRARLLWLAGRPGRRHLGRVAGGSRAFGGWRAALLGGHRPAAPDVTSAQAGVRRPRTRGHTPSPSSTSAGVADLTPDAKLLVHRRWVLHRVRPG
jgi:hypothetical protein